ncbi:uncharacterized protein LOC128676888 [Plodia interpunctella]|uniref:uncharacterized protein LOC128676888 n=1 Tax=Plodia interpunctella TaxID=58824 RepID=UPI0023679882|nr:uncharacterized protein LOC128676888 [Plodia interpunctella]
MKILAVVLMLLACCYCCCYCLEGNELLLEDSRAKKKKSSLKIWAMILLLVFSKVAAIKVATFFMFLAFFQKLFYLVGIVLNYFLKSRIMAPKPQPVYGAPQDYNTLGYSYGPPEDTYAAPENSLPAVSDIGGSLNWLFNKNH